MRILAIDVGAGTQDILLYESGKPVENCPKLVLPSQTQIVAGRVRAATAAGKPLHLTGTLMGGGASSDAVKDHLAAGLPVTAKADAGRTLHNDPSRVAALGVVIQEEPPTEAVVVDLTDIDLAALAGALEPVWPDRAPGRRRGGTRPWVPAQERAITRSGLTTFRGYWQVAGISLEWSTAMPPRG